jgi:hypothetical protein
MARSKSSVPAASAARVAPAEPPAPIWIYDFRDQPGTPDGPVSEAWFNGRHAALAALLRDLLAFYETELNWRSYDDKGGRLAVFLDSPRPGGWSDPYLAYLGFSGPKTYANDYGRLYRFDDFALAPDYVAHEFQHLVTQRRAALNYGEVEQAALSESLSDVFGIAFRHWRARRLDPAAPIEWRFGAGTALAPLSCTRNLAEPGDPAAWTQALAHWSERTEQTSAYALAGVPSRAFHLATTLLGADVVATARLWFAALGRMRAAQAATLPAFAELTFAAAAPAQEAALRQAWAAVGIGLTAPLRA